MTSKNEHPRLELLTEARRLLVFIRQVEAVSPNCFGETGDVIRQLAAGDDVTLDDLTVALVFVRLTLQEAAALSGGIGPSRFTWP